MDNGADVFAQDLVFPHPYIQGPLKAEFISEPEEVFFQSGEGVYPDGVGEPGVVQLH